MPGGYNSSRQPLKPFGNARYPQRVYQASVENAAEGDENSEAQEQDSYNGGNASWLGDEASDHEESEYNDEYFGQDVKFVTAASDSPSSHACSRCDASFRSRNLLFKHLRQKCWNDEANNVSIASTGSLPSSASSPPTVGNSPSLPASSSPAVGNLPPSPAMPDTTSTSPIVRSVIKPDATKGNAGYAFRNWHYATSKMRIATEDDGNIPSEEKEEEICVDSGCPVTLGDRQFMKRQLGEDMRVQQLASPLPVRGVGGKLVKTSDFVRAQLFISGTDAAGNSTTAAIIAEVHLVDDLKANMLVGVDVLKPQKMTLDFEHNTLTIGSYGVTAAINPVTRAKPHIKRTIRSQKAFTVLPGEVARVPVIFHGELPNDRDFLFEPQCSEYLGHDGGVFAHIVDSSLSFIQVRNSTESPVTLPRRGRLGSVVEYNQQGCYQTTVDESPKAACGWMSQRTIKKSWKAKLAKAAAVVASAYAVTTGGSSPSTGSGSSRLSTNTGFVSASVTAITGIPQIDLALEYVCPNGVTIYGSPEAANPLAALVEEYQDLFVDKGTTLDIPEEEWMPINLKADAVAKPAKVYPLGHKDREVVDKTFDNLHEQGKMRYTTQPTPFSYPVCWWEETAKWILAKRKVVT